MKLSEWLTKHDRTTAWLAREVGRHPSVMSRLVRGHIRPTNDVVAHIEILTRFEVTAVDHEKAFQARQTVAP